MIAGKITWEDMNRGIDTQAYYYNSEQNYNSCSENIICICKIKMCRVCPKGMYSPGGVGQTCISCPKTQQTAIPTIGSKYSVRYFDNSSCATGQRGMLMTNLTLTILDSIKTHFVVFYLFCSVASLAYRFLFFTMLLLQLEVDEFPKINAGSLYRSLV